MPWSAQSDKNGHHYFVYCCLLLICGCWVVGSWQVSWRRTVACTQRFYRASSCPCRAISQYDCLRHLIRRSLSGSCAGWYAAPWLPRPAAPSRKFTRYACFLPGYAYRFLPISFNYYCLITLNFWSSLVWGLKLRRRF